MELIGNYIAIIWLYSYHNNYRFIKINEFRIIAGTVNVTNLKQAKYDQIANSNNSPKFIESKENFSGLINNVDIPSNKVK